MGDFGGLGWFLIIMSSIACAAGAGDIAQKKGYSQVSGFVVGLFFGVIGLIAYAGMPDKTLQDNLLRVMLLLESRDQQSSQPSEPTNQQIAST